MVILLTTANFPDVMLPSYNMNRAACIFFIFFLLFGLYFLLNVLLAIVFDNYKSRIEAQCSKKANKRTELVIQHYVCYDREGKGYLTIDESKKFFALLMDLNYANKQDR
jgi:two pore calcium channel protein